MRTQVGGPPVWAGKPADPGRLMATWRVTTTATSIGRWG
jgi:hypothetical protein